MLLLSTFVLRGHISVLKNLNWVCECCTICLSIALCLSTSGLQLLRKRGRLTGATHRHLHGAVSRFKELFCSAVLFLYVHANSALRIVTVQWHWRTTYINQRMTYMAYEQLHVLFTANFISSAKKKELSDLFNKRFVASYTNLLELEH